VLQAGNKYIKGKIRKYRLGGVLTMGDKSPKNTQKMKKNAEKKVTAPKPSTAPESKPK
jgi:hypothetical protein